MVLWYTMKSEVMDIKKEFLIQFNGNEYKMSDIERKIKEIWRKDNRKIKEIKDLKIYVNNGVFYIVINDNEKMVINGTDL